MEREMESLFVVIDRYELIFTKSLELFFAET